MEKRTLLAVVLSLLVLYVYGALSPKPNQADISQISDNKELADYSETSSTALDGQLLLDVPPLPAPSPSVSEEKFNEIENDKLIARFSNIGGNLKEVVIKRFDRTLPIKNILNVSGYEAAGFQLREAGAGKVVYDITVDGLIIKKIYYFSEDGYVIDIGVEFSNASDMSKVIPLSLDAYVVDMSSLDKSQNQQTNMLFEYSANTGVEIVRKKGLTKFSSKEDQIVPGAIEWMGFRDQYFCAIVKPEFTTQAYSFKSIDEKRLKAAMQTDRLILNPGDKIKFEAKVYYGPQDMALLKKHDPSFAKIVNFSVGGFFDIMAFGLTDPIAKVMHRLLGLFYRIIPNWGLAIIFLAVTVYSLTYPLTLKSLNSMKKMQVLQPELLKIKERHKNNPQKMQQETMEFYKKHKFNPFGGCLPMLAQMPLFVSLYQLLWRSFEFKGANFLWIKDLSEPDRLFLLPFKLPVLGNEFNLLPILYAILMFIQQKFSSKNMPSTGDQTQADIQKMMSRFLPVFLGIVFYKFASGLTLYFTVYFALTTITQWKMSKSQKAA